MRRSAGFTIVELLVVVATLAILASLLLPSLGSAKESTRAVYCRSNLRTIQTGWELLMQRDKFKIPYTRQTFFHPNWIDGLNAIFPDRPFLAGTNTVSFNACPTVQVKYVPINYSATWWGYAINTWWSNAGTTPDEQYNEHKSWHAIRKPSRYPWFTDTEVYQPGSTFSASPRLPNTASTYIRWGVGPNHGNGDVFNVVYADQSVRSEHIDQMHALAPGGGDFTWFENR